MKTNGKFDQIQFVSSRKNYNVSGSLEKLVGSLVKGDMVDGDLASDTSYMHLRRTTVKETDEKRKESIVMPTIIENGTEEVVESPSPAKKSISKRFSSSGKKNGLLDGSVKDEPNETTIFPATDIDA